MSRGPETTFIASVHRHLPKSLYWMKNHNQFNSGIADCWYDGPNGDLWVEYKFIEVPKKSDTVIDLCNGKNPIISKLQQNWLKDRVHNGRHVAVVVGCKEGGVWIRNRLWEKPVSAAEFRDHIQKRSEIAKIITFFCRG